MGAALSAEDSMLYKSATLVVIVFVLALAAWSVFYAAGMPLDGGSTLVVVGVVTLLVIGVQRLIAPRGGKPGDE